MTDLEILTALLEGLDIPALRIDLSKTENLRWLSRNLAINNPHDEKLDQALTMIRQLLARE